MVFLKNHDFIHVNSTVALLMSTHNICFHGEIRKILCGYPLLSVAMLDAGFQQVSLFKISEIFTILLSIFLNQEREAKNIFFIKQFQKSSILGKLLRSDPFLPVKFLW